MAVRYHFSDDPNRLGRSDEEKFDLFGRTTEEGEEYFARRRLWHREFYGPSNWGTAEVATQPKDMYYCDITPLPPTIKIESGETFPLPLAVIIEVINRTSHRVITRHCTCRYAFDCQSYDANIGCLHIGAATAEEPDTVARHVSKEEAIEHVKFAVKSGLLPFVGKMDVDNEVWGIWSGEPMFTVCLCCPCCCIPRRGYQYLHPENKSWQFHAQEGLQWKLDTTKCLQSECQSCVRQCPAKALSMVDGKVKYDRDKCIFCGRCQTLCQKSAIDIETKDIKKLVNDLFGRLDGQCGDLGFEGREYADSVLETAAGLTGKNTSHA